MTLLNIFLTSAESETFPHADWSCPTERSEFRPLACGKVSLSALVRNIIFSTSVFNN